MTLSAWLLAGMMAASGADMAATIQATQAGAVEANPFLRSRSALLIGKTTVGTVQVIALAKGSKRHPMLTKIIAAISIGAYAGLAVHNYRVYQGQRR